MIFRFLSFVILFLTAHHGVAQNPTCQPGFKWSFNSLNQSPCDIGAILQGVCLNRAVTLQPLAPGIIYLGPDLAQASPCTCNTVLYSLLSACAACQLRLTTSWTIYRKNCGTVYSQRFMAPIPPTTSVPSYAYLDVTASDNFNLTSAIAVSGEPPASSATTFRSSSPETSEFATRTSNRNPNTILSFSFYLTTSTSPTATNSSNNNSKIPIIAAVVGGVATIVGAIITAGWWLRGRQSRQGVEEFPLQTPRSRVTQHFYIN